MCISDVPDHILAAAEYRMKVIAEIALYPRVSKGAAVQAGKLMGRHPRTVYRMVRAYLKAPYLTTFLPRKYQPNKAPTSGRLPAVTEKIVEEVIARYYTGRKEAMSQPNLLRLINRACRLSNTTGISPSTLQRRIGALPLRVLAMAKKGRRHPDDLKLKPGQLVSSIPLEYVQIDHTVVDQFLDLTEFGLGIRRPWLTLAIDIATRGIYGYCISLKCPNGMSNATTMLVGSSPKKVMFERLRVSLEPFSAKGITDPWFLCGRPGTVGCDNALDFVKGIFPAGCGHLGIKILPRPIGSPHFGGHIERLMGTMMAAVHMLPGTSFSNVNLRDGYDSERHACMSLEEFEQWLILNICRYHLTPHTGLGHGCSPWQKYQELKGNIPALWQKIDLAEVQRAFLKREPRIITNRGLRLHNRFYACKRLAPFVGHKVMVAYQPSDLGRVFVSLDFHMDHMEVPLAPHQHTCRHEDLWTMTQQALAHHYQDQRLTELTQDLLQAQLDVAEASRRRPRRRQIGHELPPEPVLDRVGTSIVPLAARPLEDLLSFATKETPNV